MQTAILAVKQASIAITVASMLGATFAQTAQPSFEVASIRPSSSGGGQSATYFRPGGFIAENATARKLIAYAYNVKDFQISGGPSWLDSEKFNITAKYEGPVAEGRQRLPWKQYREQLGRTVQLLLEDRFKLRVTHQPRESPIFALVVAKGGPKLSRSALDTYEADIRGRRGQLIAKGLSVAQLADILSWMPEIDGRKVVDQTGIRGAFDFSLRWAFERAPSADSTDLGAAGALANTAAPPDTSVPSIFTVLQKELGLKLEATKGPVDYLVVDYIEKPSEN